ncbi:SDR family NAD(P)-dependent oxidoreductase [Acidisoma cladoniae]|jgi:NAD(P)-dependent dehydrogenase (short-subunit alcohol dehydrogenase family)|uniref:SDR family NAD(P)-dependent oxidoreductase n=1 Tax=Acidisoma cladoniae TaxID=3040935 RepID=UPI00254FC33B|nr:SDR family NAD(P)-dependent oxidoreductase [Acidisoma sp. PAMC 29798]
MAYEIDLSGRAAFITGGTRGIGLACAHLLGQAGASVTIAGRSVQEGEVAVRSLTQAGVSAQFVALDVTSEEQVCETLARSASESGIDILVNSAGVARHRDTTNVDAELWNTVVDTNFKGTFLCCREGARHMIAQGRGGAIVNIGSISGIIANVPQNQAVYNASKAAVHMLTKSLASEFAASGIRVNAIAPGYVRTDMTKGGLENPVWAKIWLDMTPMGRVCEPEEVAQAVLFMASKASSYITGEVLTIDGGYTLR